MASFNRFGEVSLVSVQAPDIYLEHCFQSEWRHPDKTSATTAERFATRRTLTFRVHSEGTTSCDFSL
jgi:uncharacterized short protein YbdD (DUF466 family)